MSLIQQKTIKLNAIIIVAIFLTGIFSLYSQSFQLLYSKNELGGKKIFAQYPYYEIAGELNMAHFPGHNYTAIDREGNKKIYSSFSTGIDGIWNPCLELFIGGEGGPVFSARNLYYICNEGMFRIENFGFNPKFTKYISFKDDWKIENQTTFSPLVHGIASVPGKADDINYAIITIRDLQIRTTDGDVISKYPYPAGKINMLVGYSGLKLSLDNDFVYLWFFPYNNDTIARFNMTTEEFDVYDINSVFPFGETEGWAFYSASLGNLYSPKYFKNTIVSYYYGANNDSFAYYPIWAISKVDTIDGQIYASNCLLRYKDKMWDTITINPPNTQYYEEKDYIIGEMFNMGGTKIAMVLEHLTDANEYKNREFIIFDILSREYTSIVMPEPSYTNEMLPICIRNYNYKGKLGLGILTRYSDFYFYDPMTGIENVDEGIYQEIGINSVYPNPVSPSKRITANIMCYADINKVDIGFYNFMGQKILNLNNQYDYSEGTHTINLTFTIPEKLSRGIYFLNVRKGSETRTQTIIVGE